MRESERPKRNWGFSSNLEIKGNHKETKSAQYDSVPEQANNLNHQNSQLPAGNPNMSEKVSNNPAFIKIIKDRIETLRPKLLDLTRRNPLLSAKFSDRSNTVIRVVDELPQQLFERLGEESKSMRIVPLPPLEEHPKDEDTKEFQNRLSEALATDEVYLAALEEIDHDTEEAAGLLIAEERELRDRIREELGMPERQTKVSPNLVKHARNHEISPSYDLPLHEEAHEDGRHDDADIQTLLLPEALQRKLNMIVSANRSWEQETGVLVLQAAFGFVEWRDPAASKSSFAPLILLPIEIEKKRKSGGVEFIMKSRGDEPQLNLVLVELMKKQFSVSLPEYDSEAHSVDDYIASIEEIDTEALKLKPRRQVAVGVFPSARLAMWNDLDTTEWNFENNEAVSSIFCGSDERGASPFENDKEIDDLSRHLTVPYEVLLSDSSQFAAIAHIVNGNNLALQGPPGTGKSQTIVNTIATMLYEGKKVLFVAEKTAALEVVFSRLRALNLHDFVLPLQATKSSKTEVIQSISERISTSGTRNPSQLDGQLIPKLRVKKNEIKKYIDFISSDYGSTGMTAHDVIGTNIRLKSVEELLPDSLISGYNFSEFDSSLKKLKNLNLNELDKETLKEIQELCTVYEDSLAVADGKNHFWSGVKADAAAAYTADSYLRLAERVKNKLEELESIINTLNECGIDFQKVDSIHAILFGFIQSFPGADKYDPKILVKILQNNACGELNAFFEEGTILKNEEKSLESLLKAPTEDKTLEGLLELIQILSRNSLKSLSESDNQSLVDGLSSKSQKLLELIQFFKSFEELCDNLNNASLFELNHVCTAIKNTPHEVLELRDSKLESDGAIRYLEEAFSTSDELKERKNKNETHFDLDVLPDISEIENSTKILQQSGFFSLFTPKYWAAKRLYRSIAKQRKASVGNAVKYLRSLSRYIRDLDFFNSDEKLKELIGFDFKGLDTKFDPYKSLVTYYRGVKKELFSNDSKSLVELMFRAPVSQIKIVPSPFKIESSFEYHYKLPQIEEERETVLNELKALNKALSDIRELKNIFANGNESTLGEVQSLSARVKKFQTHWAELSANNTVKEIFDNSFNWAAETNGVYLRTLAIANDSEKLPAELSSILIRSLNNDKRNFAELSRVFVLYSEHRKSILIELDEFKNVTGLEKEFSGDSFFRLLEEFKDGNKDRDGLLNHAKLTYSRKELVAWIDGDIIDKYFSGLEAAKNLSKKVKAWIYMLMTNQIFFGNENILIKYTGKKLSNLRASIAQLDSEIIELSSKKIRNRLLEQSKPTSGVGKGKKSEWTDMALINNELNKKKRHIPSRELVKRASGALFELKPCWMMSPLAVAQYIPKGDIEFDLLTIDEASQMTPEDSIGALARSKKVMVVGDTNQLPPSNFFKKILEDEDEDEDKTTPEESILELANSAFHPNAKTLKWHYRSRHESLIAFSNKYIYDSQLVVFPSPYKDKTKVGISMVKVDGVFKSRINQIEAQAVVKGVLEFMQKHPDRSLGVVTMNITQRDLIKEMLEYEMSHEKHVAKYVEKWNEKNNGLDYFFVKNLENVQGDERDVIFVCTLYGPSEPGATVLQRFGPINGVSGKRRLNVLFTRARFQMVTYTSMDSSDIRSEEHQNPGTWVFKKWLEYCATGIIDSGTESIAEPDSDFEVHVIEQIKSLGCEAVPQVGVGGFRIDIGVRHPKWPHGYIMGVECDGATYHSSKSARDRDRLRQEVLEGLGWNLYRIWSTDWFQDHVRETESLGAAIEKRVNALLASAP